MKLPLSSAAVPRLVELPEIGSTNDELLMRASAGFEPNFSALITARQTKGRGRLGRVWVAPPGKTIAVSVLIRPITSDGNPLGIDAYGWLPLIAGAAMTEAVTAVVDSPVALKWPNDVLVSGLKVSGILAELLPGGDALVVGAGVNLTMVTDELPTETSTSLLLAGATLSGDELTDAVLSRYLTILRELVGRFETRDGDAYLSGIAERVTQLCATIGQNVRVALPAGDDVVGVATGLDSTGRLVVREQPDDKLVAVAAGDVTHLRYE